MYDTDREFEEIIIYGLEYDSNIVWRDDDGESHRETVKKRYFSPQRYKLEMASRGHEDSAVIRKYRLMEITE